ncbi:unnamed protein product [Mycena citricolor]|uniref:Uncharacterized protein n=1 Tax=Mycena citricolor TaxID=2018698 RepID=A0AAD2H2V6_9AGAR|nr:unnamed protein product [Mycena citricolor]
MSSFTELEESSVVWRSRVLISAAVVFFDDFLLTLPQEVLLFSECSNLSCPCAVRRPRGRG